MNLNDDSIKSILTDYHSAQTEGEKEKQIKLFRKEIELYIYNFPRLAYRKNRDFCSDFYLYVIERLDSVIRNYPLQANIRFKTWFNYVLKNQFMNYVRYHQIPEPVQIPFEDYEIHLSQEVDHGADEEFSALRDGLKRLSDVDRVLIRFYYLPEELHAEDIRFASKIFGLSLRDVLTVQKKLIAVHLTEIKRIRDITSKIAEVSTELIDLKYELHRLHSNDLQSETDNLKEKSDLLIRLSRLEEKKSKLIRRLEIPKKDAMEIFGKLFDNIRKARYRLNSAKNKLRFELLKIYREREGNL